MNKDLNSANEKTPFANAQAVCSLFTPIAGGYRRGNRILTFGLDGYWRRRAARIALREPVSKALDVCTGTGEMAACLCHRGGPTLEVTAVDFNEAMLAEARHFAQSGRILFLNADATRLPFPDEQFDLVTVSFALRNLNVSPERFEACFSELRRVLRPGGRLVTVETSQPPNGLVRRILHAYARMLISALGGWISGARTSYAYLAATIPRFHSAPELAGVMRRVGFRESRFTHLTFGAVAVHESFK
jgi:demethylmenaquinone methyltransferase/2-methoxy-6-polyprenyl-1,4-benzoquinol methylase